jgi:hypothetical protein
MSLYQNISPFIEYLHSIRKIEGYLSLDIKIPTKWGLPKSVLEDGQTIPFETGDETLKGISFVTNVNEKEINDTLSKISKVIKLNKDREIKERLFKETVDRLKSTFEKNDLDKLKTLYFDFETDEPKLDEDETNGQVGETVELAG